MLLVHFTEGLDWMAENNEAHDENQLVTEVIHTQLQHFQHTDPPCRGLQLPDGILLRHTMSRSLYFYLRTGIDNGKIKTRIFSSDSPYDREKAMIGEVNTPMFEHEADGVHMAKLERLLRDWVDFVQEEPDTLHDFRSFSVGEGRR
jgi:hypothetical protein